MKLLGRLNRSATKKDRSGPSCQDTVARNERKCSKAGKEFSPSPPREDVDRSNSHQNVDNISRSTGLSFSPSRYEDDATVGGGMTVYDWSVADNAPSVGSAGRLFDDMHQPVERVVSAPKDKVLMPCFPRRKRGHCHQEDSNSDGCNRSIGEQHDEPGELSFQYSTHSNSPFKTNGASVISDATPLRRGGREWNDPNRSFDVHPDDIQSTPRKQKVFKQDFQAQKEILDATYNSKGPIDVDEYVSSSLDRYRANEYKCPALYNESTPVDVDDYIGVNSTSFKTLLETKKKCPPPQLKDEVELYIQGGKTKIITPLSQPLSTELKGRIHATYLNNYHESCHEDYILRTSDASTPFTTDDFSIENLGDANASFGIMTKNLKVEEGNHSLGTIWLLDGNEGDAGLISARNWELEQLPVNNFQQEKSPETNKIKKSSMKKRVTNRIQSLIGSKSQKVQNRDSCIEKCELKRDISMEPLVGGSIIPQCHSDTKGKTRKAKLGRNISMIPLADSSQRSPQNRSGRKSKSKLKQTHDLSMTSLSPSNRKSCMSSDECQSPTSVSHKSVQTLNTSAAVADFEETDTHIRKGVRKKITESRSESENGLRGEREKIIPFEGNVSFTKRDRKKNRQILENWVMGKSFQEFKNTSEEVEKTSEHLPSTFDIVSRASSERTPHSCITARVDNTNSKRTVELDALDANFPDDSSAQTPERSSPPALKHNFSCVVCKEKERTHLASPCMHFSYCQNCADVLKKSEKRCRVCNAVADTFSKVLY